MSLITINVSEEELDGKESGVCGKIEVHRKYLWGSFVVSLEYFMRGLILLLAIALKSTKTA